MFYNALKICARKDILIDSLIDILIDSLTSSIECVSNRSSVIKLVAFLGIWHTLDILARPIQEHGKN